MDQEKIWDYFQTTGVAAFSHSTERLRFIARKIRPGTRVLNIGVGNGHLEALILQQRGEVWSLDPSGDAIKRLQETHAVGDRAKVGYSQSISFEQDMFDVVVMTEVLEHLV
jgi:2-polyprenyl-3-methyl-5-hydroxy-6-metoxy-1,4-benzoquinol methylase